MCKCVDKTAKLNSFYKPEFTMKNISVTYGLDWHTLLKGSFVLRYIINRFFYTLGSGKFRCKWNVMKTENDIKVDLKIDKYIMDRGKN